MARRRSIITAISHAISDAQAAERRRQREAQRNYQINSIVNSNSGPKEKEPTYTITSVEFNKDTRNCKIEILQKTEYRSIEKYVTQNYVKHPIYSNWKTKTKNIKKSLKLTDENLELLNKHEDLIIRNLSTDIIEKIDDEEFYPSWYLKEIIEFEQNSKIIRARSVLEEIKKKNDEQKNFILKSNSTYKTKISTMTGLLKNGERLEGIYFKKYDKIEKSSKPILLKIITFGVYAILYSDKRKNKYKKLYDEIKSKNKYYRLNIENYNLILKENDSLVKDLDKYKNISIKSANESIKSITNEMHELIEQIVPLTAE